MSIEDDYVTPKLDGQRVSLKTRLQPRQHKHAWIQAHKTNLSMADYVGALIDRDAGLPNALDNPPDSQELPLTG